MRKRGQEQRGLWGICGQRARWKVWRERKLCAMGGGQMTTMGNVARGMRMMGAGGRTANVRSCVVLSMDARHMGALSGTSGNSLEVISTRFGPLGSCWVYQIDQIIRPLRMPGGIRDTSVPTLEYGV